MPKKQKKVKTKTKKEKKVKIETENVEDSDSEQEFVPKKDKETENLRRYSMFSNILLVKFSLISRVRPIALLFQ